MSIATTSSGVETTPSQDIDPFQGLDDTLPCEYRPHQELGHDSPAEWALRGTGVRPCGHHGRHLVLICDPCWKYMREAPCVHCAECGHRYSLTANLISVVHL